MRTLTQLSAGSATDPYTEDQLRNLVHEYRKGRDMCALDNFRVIEHQIDDDLLDRLRIGARYKDGRSADSDLATLVNATQRMVLSDPIGAISATHYNVELFITYDPEGYAEYEKQMAEGP